MPLINPGVQQIITDVSDINFVRMDELTRQIIAAKHSIDSELAPFICLYDSEIINTFDTLVNKIGFNFPAKNYKEYLDKLGIQPKLAQECDAKGWYTSELIVYFHASDEDQKVYRDHLKTLTDYEKRALTSRIRS